MPTSTKQQQFCGREFSAQEVALIREVVQTCAGISRTELAHTVCELLDWKRAAGGLKARECRDLLERLESQGVLTLPGKKPTGSTAPRKYKATIGNEGPYCTLTGSVEEFAPVTVQLVEQPAERQLFKELVGRYHYLGYAMPYGARLQYLVHVNQPRHQVVGCVQFSSPAWQMKARDQWIGWDNGTRKLRLQHVVNNSRLLVLAQIRNLASTMLACVLRQLRSDWQRHYNVQPFLAETLVDQQRFRGGCYRAANWIEVGQTTGRGRMDRTHQRHGAAVKTVWIYPLVKHAARRLREGR